MMESIAQQAAKDARDVFSDDRQAQAAIGYMEQLVYAALRNVEYDLTDPVTVHANMLRGAIARPTVEQIIHLYGVDALTKALAPVIVRETGIEPVAAPMQYRDAGPSESAVYDRTGLPPVTVAAPNLKRVGTGIYETHPAPDPAAITADEFDKGSRGYMPAKGTAE